MSPKAKPVRNVVPDKVDFRDRVYQPSVIKAPPPKSDALFLVDSKVGDKLPVLDQSDSSACTGFALANVVNFLRRLSGLEPDADVSAQMLYSMARRYDEFPGGEDTGSSVRGALKGWFRHGAAAARTWPNGQTAMPEPDPQHPEKDWWFDAVRRPLGAYYRVEAQSIADLHVVLSEVGVVYASAICHAGWEAGFSDEREDTDGVWEIPAQPATPADGGHAFVIYGYDSRGFLVLNSWGEDWGSHGRARLSYEDWIANAMDCWVAQLGVARAEHFEVARAGGLRVRTGKVVLSNDSILREREIAPFVVDMGNNGRLNNSGRFRSKPEDVASLLKDLLVKARNEWKLGPADAIDVAIYAHGGLTSEEGAAETASRWIPALYDAHVFPIFFFWENGLLTTLANIVEDALRGQPRPAAGLVQKLDSWWSRRLEQLLAEPGTAVWGEMKENGRLISTDGRGGARILYDTNEGLQPKPLAPKTTRLHLIGHSAGAIVHSHLAAQLAAAGWRFESVTFMAPAVRVDEFEKTLLPLVRSGQVARYLQLHLQDKAELEDPTCRPILGYGRSLLYLVSESFEGGKRTPILGMEKYYQQKIAGLAVPKVVARTPADISSPVATHGGFDDDDVVRRYVIREIRKSTATAGKAGASGRSRARVKAASKKRPAGGKSRPGARRSR